MKKQSVKEINEQIEALQRKKREAQRRERDAMTKQKRALRYEIGNLFVKYFPDTENIKFEGSKQKAESFAQFEKFLAKLSSDKAITDLFKESLSCGQDGSPNV